MTTAEFNPTSVSADPGVYAPQEDSWLLVEAADSAGVLEDASVLDMCTGSGAVAVAAARLGAKEVVAFDISARAVTCALRNADAAGVVVDARVGSFSEAESLPAFDVVLCNPPYVPSTEPPTGSGLFRAWDAGSDGRSVLNPLCASASRLVADGGVLLVVQSEFADPTATTEALDAAGFDVGTIARRSIDFGPVMHERAPWLERTGRLQPGRRVENLVVLRADKR